MLRTIATSTRGIVRRARIGTVIKSRVFIAATAVATTALISFGVAQASIPDSNGVLHGCYKTADKGGGIHGGLKVLDTAVSANCPFGQPIQLPTKGQLLYQDHRAFLGPYTSGQTVASFTVPAGLMCVTGTASAFTTTPGGATLFLNFSTPDFSAPPSVNFSFFTNEALSHKALVGLGTVCSSVGAGTYPYVGAAAYPETTSDTSDVASLSVQVFAN